MRTESAVADATRESLVQRGRQLEYVTVGYNSLEGLIAILAGLIAGSVALVGFGLDSVIEVTSGTALLWRLGSDVDQSSRERAETVSLKIVGVCFLALAVNVSYNSVTSLIHHNPPERSLPGILLAVASLVVMPLLARAKRRIAKSINSHALRADAKQTEFCTYLSAILLAGLLLNAFWGWWWADPMAALLMVPIILKEGIEALQEQRCCG